MYEYIKGELISLSPTTAVIETAGIGYSISISLNSQSSLQGQKEAKLYTHLYTVQDQAPVLFGFATELERALFRLLISVSGIGGGTARIMLSSHTAEELCTIISTGNVKVLTSVKGIGAKTAEVVIVKLRDKVMALSPSIALSEESSSIVDMSSNAAQALEALQVLGFSKVAIQKAIKKVTASDPTLSVEDIIRQSLTQL